AFLVFELTARKITFEKSWHPPEALTFFTRSIGLQLNKFKLPTIRIRLFSQNANQKASEIL
ncbi:hypothetical protein V7147_00250, partial [Bacillus sp. JJ1521]|uniref:hypothetical protein n=1 Tax=Bacillus sp. JJ1521 TaxID=3122957 RepID=UPI002FFD885D